MSTSSRPVARVRPMLASAGDDPPLQDERLVYEPKYDGMRALAEITPETGTGRRPGLATVAIWSRLGNDKTPQFPELVEELGRLGQRRRKRLVLDGEIVALDERGEPTSFLRLQGRIHIPGRPRSSGNPDQPVAYVAFDVLVDGADDVRHEPFAARRQRLEQVLRGARRGKVWLAASHPRDGRRLYRTAVAKGWEGLIAKDRSSRYLTGRRSPAWRKLKLQRSQEFVVGGWTDPRSTRQHFGALLVGVHDADGGLRYAGHVGSGFSDAELARLAALLRERHSADCPFTPRPPSGDQAHWVRPELIAEVKYTEWSDDGILRHPVYLGLREDKAPEAVRREPTARRAAPRRAAGARRSRQSRQREKAPPFPPVDGVRAELLDELERLEAARKRGTITADDGGPLEVGNLDKIFWPAQGLTKGALLRFYVRIAPFLLPAVADRPLVMKRFPNGVKGKSFYQHRAPDPVPEGLRVATVRESPERADTAVPYLIGGSFSTLVYMAQLAVISQDPWFSRLPAIAHPDLAAFDLDPMPGVDFRQILDVACWIHDELERIGVPSVAKTSGSEGLHIYVPLPPDHPYEAGQLFCQIVATMVATAHPKAATVERMVRQRPGGTVYIDYLQNIYGKTLATAYSARASPFAGVSTPVSWPEVHAGAKAGLRPEDFTIRTIFGRLEQVGDLWAHLRDTEPANLREALEHLSRSSRSTAATARAARPRKRESR